MSVTIVNGSRTLTLTYDPVVLEEPTQYKISRSFAPSFGGPIMQEFQKVQVRERLRLYIGYLTKANADTLHTMLGEAGLLTINIKKEFPVTTTNPTSYRGIWAEDGRCWVKPLLSDTGYVRNEHATWDALPDEFKVYHAEVELVIQRNDEV